MNLQPFDIERARQGVPVRTSGGYKARIVCWDMAASTHPIVALVTDKDGTEHVEFFTDSGHNSLDLADESYRSLMLCPDDIPAQKPPRNLEEFSIMCPIKAGEAYIDSDSRIISAGRSIGKSRRTSDRNWCTSKGEAEAFLSLMQLRQIRKAWIGDWDFVVSQLSSCYAIVYTKNSGVRAREVSFNHPMSFPTMDMAVNFLSCFKTLCETAKRLL